MRLKSWPVELPVVIEAAVETIRPLADDKSVDIETVMEAVDRPMIGDPERLRQVFSNLLSNAVKFTPQKGRIKVHLQDVNSRVEIRVIDTGQGIPPEFLPRLFQPFSQADPANSSSNGGLGLGLSIARRLVELHGGTIKAESAGLGQGAIFTVCLPFNKPKAK
jgi:signal transduction histidine kinase